MHGQISQLQKDLAALSQEFYRNNFSAHQDFNKASTFTSKLKVPHYASLPATCEIGEIVESGGKLYIGSAADTWSLVGTQT